MPFDINRFHFVALLAWQFILVFIAQLIFPIFSNFVPEWRCGSSGAAAKNCDEFRRCAGNVTFVTESPFASPFAIEFGWLCDGARWAALFSQCQFIGLIVGTLSLGALSDGVGRKWVAAGSLGAGLSFSIISSRLSSFVPLLVSRFLVGFSLGGAQVVGCTLIMEMLLPRQRMALRGFFNWGATRLLLTAVCYVTGEWRAALVLLTAIAAPALAIILFVLPESPTWLHCKGRVEEMRKSEKTIARRAGVPYVPQDRGEVVKTQGVRHVLRSSTGRSRIGVLWCMWFTASLCSYTVDFNSGTLSGNLYVNQTLFGILTWISKLVLLAVDSFYPAFSRRRLHQGAQAGAVACFAVLTALTLSGYTGIAVLIVNLAGIVFVEYTWDACYLCAVESMETATRSSVVASSSIVARIAGTLAPSLAFMNEFWSASVYCVAMTLGAANLAVSYFFLVETKGVNLSTVHIDDDGLESDDNTREQQMPLKTNCS